MSPKALYIKYGIQDEVYYIKQNMPQNETAPNKKHSKPKAEEGEDEEDEVEE